MTSTMTDQSVNQDSQQSARIGLPRAWWLLMVILVLLRILLVADDRIIPLNYDSTYYAQGAAHYFSSDAFSMLPTHRPGLSLVAWGCSQLGLPFKLALDGLFVALVIATGVSMFRLTQSVLVSLGLAATLLVHPWFMVHSQMFMTEAFVAILLLALVLSAIPWLIQPIGRWPVWNALFAASVGALYALTRNEFLLLAGFQVLVGVLVLFPIRKTWRSELFQNSGGWRVLFLILPVVAAWAGTMALKAWHDYRFGVPAVCATEADGFTDLMNALYQVKPDSEQRFVPVPRSTLQKSCEVSQIMRARQRMLLDTNRTAYERATAILNTENEVGTWLNWHLVDCFGGVDRNSNNRMRVAARQIREAAYRNEIELRTARFPVDPLWKAWLPELPTTLANGLAYSFADSSLNYESRFLNRRVMNAADRSFFEIGLLRRGGAGFNRAFSFSGSPLKSATDVTSLQLLDAKQALIVEVPIRENGKGMQQADLAIDDAVDPAVRHQMYLRLVRDHEQKSYSLPMEIRGKARKNRVTFLFPKGNGSYERETWVVSFNRSGKPDETRNLVKRKLIQHCRIPVFLILLTSFVIGWRNGADQIHFSVVGCIALLALGLVALRTLFYSAIQVWLSWGLARYVEPNLFVLLVGLVALAWCAGSMCGVWSSRSTPSTADPVQ